MRKEKKGNPNWYKGMKSSNPWGRRGKPKKRVGSLGLVNNPWGRNGKPMASGVMNRVNIGLDNLLISPFN